MAVDAVPHHLPHEAADLAKAAHAIELRHPHGHLVAAHFGYPLPRAGMNEPGLARAGAQPRFALHALHEQLEVARGHLEIHVELADIVEVVEVERGQATVEGLDHARADGALAA